MGGSLLIPKGRQFPTFFGIMNPIFFFFYDYYFISFFYLLFFLFILLSFICFYFDYFDNFFYFNKNERKVPVSSSFAEKIFAAV